MVKTAGPDVKNSAIEVDIRPVQTEGFVHPHSRRHQQTERGCIGVGAEAFKGGELLGLAEEPFNLSLAVDMGNRR